MSLQQTNIDWSQFDNPQFAEWYANMVANNQGISVEQAIANNPSFFKTVGDQNGFLDKFGPAIGAGIATLGIGGALAAGGVAAGSAGGTAAAAPAAAVGHSLLSASLVPTLINAGTSIAGGILGSNAAKNAAATQSQAALATIPLTNKAVSDAQNTLFGAQNGAIGWQEALMQYANSKLQPYQAQGGQATSNIADILDNDPSLNNKFAFNPTNGIQAPGQFSFSPTNGVQAPGQFSFNPSDLSKDPGYQFTLDQGIKSVNQSAAAKGMALSGGTIKGTENYATGLAQNTFQNAFQRALEGYNANSTTYNNQFNQAAQTYGINENNYNNQFQQALQGFTTNRDTSLSKIAQEFGLANMGFTAANQMGQNAIGEGQWAGNTAMSSAQLAGNWGLQGAGLVNNAITGAANANAAGTVGSANAWTNALGGISGSANNAMQMYLLSQMFNKGGGGGGATPPFVSPDASYQFGG